MNLYFLRHGDAGPNVTSDSVLTPEGINSIRKVGERIKDLKISLDQLLVSPLPRARETADIICTVLNTVIPVEICDPLSPPGNCDTLIGLLKETHKVSVLMVGHEPLLSQIISRLVSGNENTFITMKKGSLAKVFVAEYTTHIRGNLEWLIPPDLMVSL